MLFIVKIFTGITQPLEKHNKCVFVLSLLIIQCLLVLNKVHYKLYIVCNHLEVLTLNQLLQKKRLYEGSFQQWKKTYIKARSLHKILQTKTDKLKKIAKKYCLCKSARNIRFMPKGK